MTPEEIALRDAFLAEMWPVVREYHHGDPTPVRRKRGRRKANPEAGDNAVERAS